MAKGLHSDGVRVYVSNYGTHRVEPGSMTLEYFRAHVRRVFEKGGDPCAEVFYAAPGEFMLDPIEEPSVWFRFRQWLAEWIAP